MSLNTGNAFRKTPSPGVPDPAAVQPTEAVTKEPTQAERVLLGRGIFDRVHGDPAYAQAFLRTLCLATEETRELAADFRASITRLRELPAEPSEAELIAVWDEFAAYCERWDLLPAAAGN